MALYKYKSMTKDGKVIEGSFNGKDRSEVLDMIRGLDHIPIEVTEVVQSKDVSEINLFNKVNTKDIAIYCRQFYTMLNAGVTIVNCLDILRYQSEKKKLRSTIDTMYEDVLVGNTFAESMRKHKDVFPELLINMTEAGEVSGNLDNIMNRMATHFEKEYKINNKVKSAMVYPAVLGIASVLIVIFLLTFIMPTFVGMFESSGVELPLPTKILLTMSNGILKYWYLVFGGLAVIIYSAYRYASSTTGSLAIDAIKLKIPVLKTVTRNVITSRFSRTMSILIISGVPLIQAIEIVSKVVGNKVVQNQLEKAKEDIRKGISLSVPVERIKAFPVMLKHMIEIGEESGSLDDILDKTADFYDEEVETSIQKMTTMLEPLMIIVMAVVVGFIVIAMMLPMFDMMNTVET